MSRRSLAIVMVLGFAPRHMICQTHAQAPQSGSIEARVDAYLKPYLDLAAFSGAVLLARHGKVLLRKGYGMASYELGVPNTPETRFHVASVSKTFTAAAILLLVERGLVSLHDPIAKFIPDYPRGSEITVHHLLAHSSGIPDINDLPGYDSLARFAHTPADLVSLFRNEPLLFDPGTRYGYSNSNYNVLASIIETVSGRSYGDFLAEYVFRPAGMSATAHDGRPETIVSNRAQGYVPVGAHGLENAPFIDWSTKSGNGSIYSTIDDLFRWDRALYAETVLKRPSIERMFTPQEGGVGYGWLVGTRLNRPVFRMSGRSPGFNAEIQRYPDDDVCVIVLSNNYAATASTIATDLAAMVFGERYEVLAVNQGVAIAASVLDAYSGRYVGGPDFLIPSATLTLAIRDGTLVMTWSSGAVEQLLPQSDSTFFDRKFWATIRFVRDASHRGTELIYHSGGRDYSARREGPIR
ncbi:MAG TPA: serine hydrolase domain-containing protein [Gemmatimonadales bacterium]|nr:serine hydrolase domain-containing protein [Gemmatimonadales bacterium]